MSIFSLSLSNIEGMFSLVNTTNKALNTREILDDAESILLNRIKTRFLAESGPNGPWVQSVRGKIRKAGGYTYRGKKGYTATGTLFETGALYHSLQAYAIDDVTSAIGTDVPYARKLQFGNPARVFLGFNAEDASVVIKFIQLRLEEG